MYGCESWTIKKAECRRNDAFELWCWRRLLRVPWTARRSNQSILKEISLGCSLEGLMLKLKLQYFGHLMWRVDILKDPDAGKDWGQEEKVTMQDEIVRWPHWLNGHGFGCSPGVGDGQGGLVCCSSWGRKESDMTEWLNWNWNWGHTPTSSLLFCFPLHLSSSWIFYSLHNYFIFFSHPYPSMEYKVDEGRDLDCFIHHFISSA